MRYLFEYWNKIKGNFAGKSVVLFLDYDGTLTPIVETPEKASLSKTIKVLLDKLSKSPRCKIAVISGRLLQDIKDRVGLRNIIYVGNHGLEIEGPKIKFKSQIYPGFLTILKHIKEELNLKLSKIKGAFIEDKGLTLSLHYRLVDKKDIPILKDIFNEISQIYLIGKKIKIVPGKKVWEVRPPLAWDKGKVVLWLFARWRFALGDKDVLPIYLGDDITDEDAFVVLRNIGITIFVGKSQKSNAEYFLKNTQEVEDFLSQLQISCAG